MTNQKISHEVHPYGVTTTIPTETLIDAFDKAFPDELEDFPTLEEKITHIEYFFDEAGPLNSFNIRLNTTDHTITILQLFDSAPPAHHQQLLLHKLNHHLEIVTTATDILDSYTTLPLHDRQARLDFRVKSYIKTQQSTEYLIKFMENRGDDTGFDYHCSYTIACLEILIEGLTPRD